MQGLHHLNWKEYPHSPRALALSEFLAANAELFASFFAVVAKRMDFFVPLSPTLSFRQVQFLEQSVGSSMKQSVNVLLSDKDRKQ